MGNSIVKELFLDKRCTFWSIQINFLESKQSSKVIQQESRVSDNRLCLKCSQTALLLMNGMYIEKIGKSIKIVDRTPMMILKAGSCSCEFRPKRTHFCNMSGNVSVPLNRPFYERDEEILGMEMETLLHSVARVVNDIFVNSRKTTASYVSEMFAISK